MVNKIVLAILVGSLLIGSSLVVLADTPPKVNDIPVLGVAGYVISAALSVWLIIRTRRDRS